MCNKKLILFLEKFVLELNILVQIIDFGLIYQSKVFFFWWKTLFD